MNIFKKNFFMQNVLKSQLFEKLLLKQKTRNISSLKNKFFYLHFYFNDFTVETFINEIIKNFKFMKVY